MRGSTTMPPRLVFALPPVGVKVIVTTIETGPDVRRACVAAFGVQTIHADARRLNTRVTVQTTLDDRARPGVPIRVSLPAPVTDTRARILPPLTFIRVKTLAKPQRFE